MWRKVQHTHTLHASLDLVSVKFLELRIVQQEKIELVLVNLRSVLQIFGIEDIAIVFQRPAIFISGHLVTA